MRYIQVPEPVRIVNPVTDEPHMVPDAKGSAIQEVFSFAKSCRTAIVVVSQKGSVDALKLIDLRTRIDEAAVGTTLMLNDDDWKLLEGEFTRPNAQAFGGFWAMGGGALHMRAWLEAKTEKPSVSI